MKLTPTGARPAPNTSKPACCAALQLASYCFAGAGILGAAAGAATSTDHDDDDDDDPIRPERARRLARAETGGN